MTCVSPEGRITPGCTGLYAPGHEAAWKRIVDFIHGEPRPRWPCSSAFGGEGLDAAGMGDDGCAAARDNWQIIARRRCRGRRPTRFRAK